MAAHDNVNRRVCRCHGHIDRIARMAKHDDLVHTHLFKHGHFAGHRIGRFGEDDIRAGACQFIRVTRGQPDQADLLATTFDYGRFRKLARQQRFARIIGIGHQHRKFQRIHEAAQRLGAIVKLVVASCHGVIAQHIHEFGRHRTLVIGVKQRALKLVAPVNKNGIIAARTRLRHGRGQAR